jgi:hypothetical protein
MRRACCRRRFRSAPRLLPVRAAAVRRSAAQPTPRTHGTGPSRRRSPRASARPGRSESLAIVRSWPRGRARDRSRGCAAVARDLPTCAQAGQARVPGPRPRPYAMGSSATTRISDHISGSGPLARQGRPRHRPFLRAAGARRRMQSRRRVRIGRRNRGIACSMAQAVEASLAIWRGRRVQCGASNVQYGGSNRSIGGSNRSVACNYTLQYGRRNRRIARNMADAVEARRAV